MSYVILVCLFMMMTCFTLTIFSNVLQDTTRIEIHKKWRHFKLLLSNFQNFPDSRSDCFALTCPSQPTSHSLCGPCIPSCNSQNHHPIELTLCSVSSDELELSDVLCLCCFFDLLLWEECLLCFLKNKVQIIV